MEETKCSVGEKVVYGAVFAAAVFLVGRLNLGFLYTVIIGGAAGGLLSCLRRPVGRFIVSVLKPNNKA